MLEVSFNLTENRIRPFIFDERYSISVLIDTGALNNVWVGNDDSLKATFGKITKVKGEFKFRGFGGETSGSLYHVEYNFCGKLLYKKFPLVVKELDVPADLILSVAALSGIDYTISDVDRVMKCVLRNNNRERHMVAHADNGEIDFIMTNGNVSDVVADNAAAFNNLYKSKRVR